MFVLLSESYIVFIMFIMQRLDSLRHIGHSCPVHRSMPVPKQTCPQANVANALVLVNGGVVTVSKKKIRFSSGHS